MGFLTDTEREVAILWITRNVSRHYRKTVDAYCLKHMCQFQTCVYCSADEFADVMRECGFMNLEGSKYTFYAVVDPAVLQAYYK